MFSRQSFSSAFKILIVSIFVFCWLSDQYIKLNTKKQTTIVKNENDCEDEANELEKEISELKNKKSYHYQTIKFCIFNLSIKDKVTFHNVNHFLQNLISKNLSILYCKLTYYS